MPCPTMHIIWFSIFHLEDVLTPTSNFSFMLPPISLSHVLPSLLPEFTIFISFKRQTHLVLPLILDAVSEGLPGAILLPGQAAFTVGSVQHQGNNMILGAEGQFERKTGSADGWRAGKTRKALCGAGTEVELWQHLCWNCFRRCHHSCC